MKNIFAYIDGFNLYHHLNDAIYSGSFGLNSKHKSLDVRKLVQEFCLKGELLGKVMYFTATPTHLKTSKILKHNNYCSDLRDICNVKVVNGIFSKKNKEVSCKNCNQKFIWQGHEEKKTDVSLAISIISDIFMNNSIDKIILVTADRDFEPVVDFIIANTDKEITVLLPINADKQNIYSRKKANKYSYKKINEKHIITSTIKHNNKKYNP